MGTPSKGSMQQKGFESNVPWDPKVFSLGEQWGSTDPLTRKEVNIGNPVPQFPGGFQRNSAFHSEFQKRKGSSEAGTKDAGGREGPRNRERNKAGRGQIRAEVETQRESRKRMGLPNTGSNQGSGVPRSATSPLGLHPEWMP